MSGMFSTSREQEGSERAGLVPNNKGGDRRLPPLAPPVRALLASPEEVSYVEGVLARNWLPYEEVTARKPTSGIRTFHRPELPFKDIQRRMLDRALNRLAPHPLAFAYRQGASVVDCAMQHLRARTIIRLDIADFFSQRPGSGTSLRLCCGSTGQLNTLSPFSVGRLSGGASDHGESTSASDLGKQGHGLAPARGLAPGAA